MEAVRAAKAACAPCPTAVRQACLDWALEHCETGVWGGTSESERRIMRRRGAA